MNCLLCRRKVKKLSKWINPNKNCHYKCWMAYRTNKKHLVKYDNFMFSKGTNNLKIFPDAQKVEEIEQV